MFVRICSNFHHTITIRQCMFDCKIGAEGSVLQELCHFLIPPDVNWINWISTGDVKHEFRTNHMLTDRDCTTMDVSVRIIRYCPVEIFEHSQNFTLDIPEQASLYILEQNGHKSDRNGHKWMKLFFSVTCPLALCDQALKAMGTTKSQNSYAIM